MKLARLALAGLAVLWTATACATDPSMWKDVEVDARPDPATPFALGEIQVSSSSIAFRSGGEQASLEKAIRKALVKGNFFSAQGERANLVAEVRGFFTPPMGASFTSSVTVHYRLVGADGADVFETEIKSYGSDDTGAFVALQRQARARTVAIANNVTELMTELGPGLEADSRKRNPTFLASLRPQAAPTPVAPPVREPSMEELEAELLVPIQLDPRTPIARGTPHAIVIGNNAYRELPGLRTARNDATAVSALLKEEYGYQVNTLLDATRSDIIGQLAQMRDALSEGDSLLVYYAGHGNFDEGTRRGYWLPVDASEQNPANWISTADISDMLRALPARHIMVVADSCYSGALTRGLRRRMSRNEEYVRKLFQKRARVVLTSGGLEPVEDGSSDHSVFAQAFLDTLRTNEGIMEGLAVFTALKRPVFLNSEQTPEYGDIRLSGHEAGGDYLFIRSK